MEINCSRVTMRYSLRYATSTYMYLCAAALGATAAPQKLAQIYSAQRQARIDVETASPEIGLETRFRKRLCVYHTLKQD